MCLKEFYTLTFTNREAYERVLKRLKKHKNHFVSGIFYIIKSYNSEIVKRTRNDYTFIGLENMVKFSHGGYISVEQFKFKGWNNDKRFIYGLNQVIEKIGNTEDIFGKIVIELR